jgi:hypothetical protein
VRPLALGDDELTRCASEAVAQLRGLEDLQAALGQRSSVGGRKVKAGLPVPNQLSHRRQIAHHDGLAGCHRFERLQRCGESRGAGVPSRIDDNIRHRIQVGDVFVWHEARHRDALLDAELATRAASSCSCVPGCDH